jgi:hypothetical protein
VIQVPLSSPMQVDRLPQKLKALRITCRASYNRLRPSSPSTNNPTKKNDCAIKTAHSVMSITVIDLGVAAELNDKTSVKSRVKSAQGASPELRLNGIATTVATIVQMTSEMAILTSRMYAPDVSEEDARVLENWTP